MAEFCPDCEGDYKILCDFCQYYAYNGKDMVDENGKVWKGAIYVDKGRCEHPEHPRAAEPDDGCDDFVCFRLPKKLDGLRGGIGDDE